MKLRQVAWASTLLIATAASTAAVADDAAAKGAPSPVCVQALITNETHEIRSDGIGSDSRYQERLYRCGTRVWIQRVLPISAAVTAMGETNAHGHDGHGREELPSLAFMPLMLTRDPQGKIEVDLIWPEKKLRVAVARSEYETVGFNGNYEQSAQIIDQAILAGLTRGSTQGGAISYSGKRGKSSLRLWWSPHWQLPTKIEVRAPNGTLVQRTKVEASPLLQIAAPWTKTASWPRKEYTDFLD